MLLKKHLIFIYKEKEKEKEKEKKEKYQKKTKTEKKNVFRKKNRKLCLKINLKIKNRPRYRAARGPYSIV